MAVLIHGGDIYSPREKIRGEILDFSANINPLGLPPGVQRAIADTIPLCVNYPDPLCRALTAAISVSEAVEKEWILCGNGAADLIFRLVWAKKPKKAILPAPTFAEYELALKSVDCDIRYYALDKEKGFALGEAFLHCIREDVDILFLCNPNNPTGKLIPRALLKKILIKCREQKVLLVMDECFIDFLWTPSAYTMVGEISQYKELFVLKAFTKNYAMPGIRLGYGLCSDSLLLDKMAEQGQPWSVSLLAQAAGVAALKEEGYLEKMRTLVNEEKKYLQKALAALGIKAYPPAANYIFLYFSEVVDSRSNEAFQEALLQKGILIRDCSNYKGLSYGYYRVAIKDRAANEKLIGAFQTMKEDETWLRQS
ncbi:MAG: threonine-phosphate decarboxylase [Anaerovorax sp.]